MPRKKYVVDLTAEERPTLEQLLQRGKNSARKLTRARILLQADEGLVEANLEAPNELPQSGWPVSRVQCSHSPFGP